jgi:hypothetical protein
MANSRMIGGKLKAPKPSPGMRAAAKGKKAAKRRKSLAEVTFSVPAAGAMAGLTRNGAYAAARRGEIPTIPFGNLLRVPRLPWLKKIGAIEADSDEQLEPAEV